jgi:putative peptidoglycan lipid II flippase
VNRLLAALALAAFVAVLVAIVLGSSSGGGGESTTTTSTTRTTRTRPVHPKPPPAPKERAVKLSAVGAFDPEGDQHENDSLAPLAVDGDTSTFWKTEHYTHGFFKKGVGLVLDTGGRHRLTQVAVGTDAPGANAQIQLGNNPNGPFHPVSADLALTGTTVYKLRKGAVGRYLVVWITALTPAIGEAHVTEVRATGI